MKTKLLLCGLFVSMIALTGCTNNGGSVTDDLYIQGAQTQRVEAEFTPVEAAPADEEAEQGEFDFSAGLDENGFWAGINVLDYVQMFNYRALAIPADVHTVPAQNVQDIVDDILRDRAETERVTDRPVQYGDTINIDFVGSIDGVEFDGGNTQGTGMYVTIGVTDFIGDFLEQLIGHMPGTVVDVEVAFPEDYWEPSLSGLDALFVTPINYIVGGDILPELTDEFVSMMFFFLDIHTVDDLYHEIEESLRDSAVQQYVFEYLRTQVVVNYIPEKIIRHYEQLMLMDYVNEAAQFGMDVEDLLAWFGFESVEDFFEASREEIEEDARFSLILQAVAEDAGIVTTLEDVTNFFIENMGTDDFSFFEEMYGLPWLKQFIRGQKVMDYINERIVLS